VWVDVVVWVSEGMRMVVYVTWVLCECVHVFEHLCDCVFVCLCVCVIVCLCDCAFV
jgi:hypothetical protein